MASFEEIMNKPSSEIAAPQAFPVGTYHCMVAGPPSSGKSSQKQTDFLTFELRILSAMADVDQKAYVEQQVSGKTIRADFYITDASAYRLKEFLVDHLGIDDPGEKKSMRELVAEAPGKQVLAKLRHELSQDGKRVFHRLESTAHV